MLHHHKQKQLKHLTPKMLYSEGSNVSLSNMPVRTERKTTAHATTSDLVHELEELKKLLKTSTRENILMEIQNITLKITGIATQSTSTSNVRFPESKFVLHGNAFWKRCGQLIEGDKYMLEMFFFVLTGNVKGKYYSKSLKIDFDQVPFVDILIDNDKGKEMLDIISELSPNIQTDRFEPLVLILVKCTVSVNKDIREDAYRRLSEVCDIPQKLFFFVHYSQKLRSRSLSGKTYDRTVGLNRYSKFQQRTPVSEAKAISTDYQMSVPMDVTITGCHLGGKRHRVGIASCYTDLQKSTEELLYFLTKYISGYNWTHKKIIQYTHPKFFGMMKELKDLLITYCLHGFSRFHKKATQHMAKGNSVIDGSTTTIFNTIVMLNDLKTLSPKKPGDVDQLINYWEEYGKRTNLPNNIIYEETDDEFSNISFHLTFQHIPEGFLKNVRVWEAILEDLPYQLLLKSLTRMTLLHLFKIEEITDKVVSILINAKRYRKAKIHPFKMFKAWREYQHNFKKHGKRYSKKIAETLEAVFYRLLKDPDMKEMFSLNKRVFVALDCRSIDNGKCYGAGNITSSEAILVFTMILHSYEDHCNIYAYGEPFQSLKHYFVDNASLEDLKDVIRKISCIRPDCLLPVEYSRENKVDADLFLVLSKNDEFTNRHRPRTLQRYRDEMHRPSTKLIVCATECHDFTYAKELGMFDICGFDENVPEFISQIMNGIN